MGTYSESLTQEQICEQNAKMLIYDSEQFCKLLNLKSGKLLNGKLDIMPLQKPNKKKCLSKLSKEIYRETLVGYYIIPTKPLSDSNNYLSLEPVWLLENDNDYFEHVGKHIVIDHFDIGQNPSNSNIDDCGAHVIGMDQNSTTQGFYHHDLQFSSLMENPDVGEIEKAFISRYELFCLVQYADYIGIVGTRISSGNIVALDQNNPDQFIHDCNFDYFTYRLIGLNSFKCHKGDPPYPNVYHKSNYLKNTEEFSVSIPGETWATPCPPRWV